MDSLRFSPKGVAERITSGKVHPDVEAWVKRVLLEAGDPKEPKARTQALMAAVKQSVGFVPDPWVHRSPFPLRHDMPAPFLAPLPDFPPPLYPQPQLMTADELALLKITVDTLERLLADPASVTPADEEALYASRSAFDRVGDCVPTEDELRDMVRRAREKKP
jgi:hypothetical protein